MINNNNCKHEYTNIETVVDDRVVDIPTCMWCEQQIKVVANGYGVLTAIRGFIRKRPLIELQDIIEEAVWLEGKEEKIPTHLLNGKIKWIENLHKTPKGDGRHRVVDLIFIPYCKNNLKFDEEETVRWINEWLEECNKIMRCNITNSYIINKYRRCRDEAPKA